MPCVGLRLAFSLDGFKTPQDPGLGIWVPSCGYPSASQGMHVESNHSQTTSWRRMTAHPSRSAD